MSMKRQWNNDRNESRLQSFLEVKKYRGGIHGLSHAQRVEKFGLMLAEKTDADRDVIIWFAYLHDSQRTDDGFDFNHGPDAARFVDTIRNAFLQELSDTQISKLKEACRLHTSTHRTWDITIDTCFDADRLDLPRVGNMPDPKRMATEQGAKYAGRSYIENCIDAGCKDLMNTTRLTGISLGEGTIDKSHLLHFDKDYINNGKESRFAIRFNFLDDKGNMFSPYYTHDAWDLTAKSMAKIKSSDSVMVTMCDGIFAVEYDIFKSGNSYYRRFVDNWKEQHGAMLLEYTQDDVIMFNEEEICIRQCNILYSAPLKEFEEKMNDGTLDNIMDDFKETKKHLKKRNMAGETEKVGESIKSFILCAKVDPRLFFRCMYYGVSMVKRLGIGDLVVLHWFLVLTCLFDLKRATDSNIFKLISTVKDKYLKGFSFEQMMKLQMALSHYANLKEERNTEFDLYADARLMGERSINDRDINANELMTQIGKGFLNNGWYDKNTMKQC